MNSLFLLDPLTEILKLFVLDIRCNYFSLQPLGLNDRNTLYRRATSQHLKKEIDCWILWCLKRLPRWLIFSTNNNCNSLAKV